MKYEDIRDLIMGVGIGFLIAVVIIYWVVK